MFFYFRLHCFARHPVAPIHIAVTLRLVFSLCFALAAMYPSSIVAIPPPGEYDRSPAPVVRRAVRTAVGWEKGGCARDCFCVIVTLVTLFTLDPGHSSVCSLPIRRVLRAVKSSCMGSPAYLSPSRLGRHRQLSVALARRLPHIPTSPTARPSSRRCPTFLPSASCLPRSTLPSILTLNLFGAGTDSILYPISPQTLPQHLYSQYHNRPGPLHCCSRTTVDTDLIFVVTIHPHLHP